MGISIGISAGMPDMDVSMDAGVNPASGHISNRNGVPAAGMKPTGI